MAYKTLSSNNVTLKIELRFKSNLEQGDDGQPAIRMSAASRSGVGGLW